MIHHLALSIDLKELTIWNSNYLNAKGVYVFIATLIIFGIVLLSIKFDCHSHFSAIEVESVWRNTMLSAKLEASLTISKKRPSQLLCHRWNLSGLSRTLSQFKMSLRRFWTVV